MNGGCWLLRCAVRGVMVVDVDVSDAHPINPILHATQTPPHHSRSGIVVGGGSSDGGSATGGGGRNGVGEEAWGSVDALSTGMDLMAIGGAGVGGWDASGGYYGGDGQGQGQG